MVIYIWLHINFYMIWTSALYVITHITILLWMCIISKLWIMNYNQYYEVCMSICCITILYIVNNNGIQSEFLSTLLPLLVNSNHCDIGTVGPNPVTQIKQTLGLFMSAKYITDFDASNKGLVVRAFLVYYIIRCNDYLVKVFIFINWISANVFRFLEVGVCFDFKCALIFTQRNGSQ